MIPDSRNGQRSSRASREVNLAAVSQCCCGHCPTGEISTEEGHKSAATGWVSTFNWLEHQKQSPQKEETWVTCPKMTPRKVERGRQLDRGQEYSSKPTGQSKQKRCSQSRPRDEVDSKKGWTECEGKNHRVQVGIDLANTGIQKAIPKPDPQHPSFKPDLSGANDSPLPPQLKSSVIARGSNWQHSYSAGHWTTTLASQRAPQVQDDKKDNKPS